MSQVDMPEPASSREGAEGLSGGAPDIGNAAPSVLDPGPDAAVEELPEVEEAILDDTTASALVGAVDVSGEPDPMTPIFQEPQVDPPAGPPSQRE